MLLGGFGSWQLAGHPAVGECVDAVADAEQLGQLRGDDDDRLARRGELVDDRVDLVLGADVDAAGRLVEDQHLRLGHHPLGEHDLLLVAAGEVPGLGHDVGGLDPHGLAVVLGDLDFLVAVHESVGGDLCQSCRGGVHADVLDEVQAELLAVLRDIGDACLDRLPDGGGVHLPAVHVDLAGDGAAVAVPEDAHRQFGAPGAHQPGDADDFAGAHLERGVVHDLPVLLGRVVHRPVLDFENDLPDLRGSVRVAGGELAADHAADDAVLGGGRVRHVQGFHRLAVADDGGGVRDVFDLPELVGNDDRGDSLLA